MLLPRGPKPSTPKGETLHCKQVPLVLYIPFEEMSSPIRRQLFHLKKTFQTGERFLHLWSFIRVLASKLLLAIFTTYILFAFVSGFELVSEKEPQSK